MPYLWSLNRDLDWIPRQLAEDPGNPVENMVVADLDIVKPRDGRFNEKYVLLWSPQHTVRLNGLQLTSGIRILADRDEIRVNNDPPVFFSSEQLVTDEVYEASDTGDKGGPASDALCPRCEKPLIEGKPVVRCPGCSLAYHYSSSDKNRDCWGFASKCSCGHSTEMGNGFRWTPHEVWE